MLAADRARHVAAAVADWTARPQPLHVALADALGLALRTGRVQVHLPSERSLALALHVSRGTVAAAYEELRERGVLVRERGSGTVARASPAHEVCPDPLDCVRTFFAQPFTR